MTTNTIPAMCSDTYKEALPYIRRPHKPTSVVLGMSGGVDSSTSARLLKDAGYNVIGVTCIFTDDEKSHAAARDARIVADTLGIMHYIKDCTTRFSTHVVDDFIHSYEQGLTPSPCVTCNRFCKIPELLHSADELGCELCATGHYARVVYHNQRWAIKCACAQEKDQSYMLSMLTQAQLSRLIFPLGGLVGGKQRVRELASEACLSVASKPDSQDICFIEGNYVDFLHKCGVRKSKGNIVLHDGTILGEHHGLEAYTLGQRKGLGIGGLSEPVVVVEKRIKNNELVVAPVSESFINEVVLEHGVWQYVASLKDLSPTEKLFAKVRYRSSVVSCSLVMQSRSFKDTNQPLDDSCAITDSPELLIRFSEAIAVTSPGQIAVCYTASGEVVCAGRIKEVHFVSRA